VCPISNLEHYTNDYVQHEHSITSYRDVKHLYNKQLINYSQHRKKPDIKWADGCFDLVERILQRLELKRMHLTIGKRLQQQQQQARYKPTLAFCYKYLQFWLS